MLAAVFPDDDVKIIDCIAEEITYKQLFKMMEDFRPTWVVFNPISSTIYHDMIVAHYGKALGAKTACISPHTKVFKEESHDRFPALDHSVEYTKGGTEPEFRLRSIIKGIPEDGTRFEDIPPARQDLLPIHKYSLPFIGKSYTFVIISRGCAWACIYCRATVQNERMPRFRPVDTVIREIKQYGLRNIAFHSDTATMNRKWMMEFCKKVPKGTRWICNSRVDTVDPEMLRAMKKAGCWMIVYGCESGNNEVLKLNKKETTVERAEYAVRIARESGLRVWGYFMLGMLGDSERSMGETIEFAKSGGFDIVNFAIAAPYPGTEFHAIVKENGWLMDERWESFDQNYSAQVQTRTFDRGTVRLMQRKAYRQWYLSWRGFRFLLWGFRPEHLMFFIKTAINHLRI